ncbi:MmgE/PrpD family protein [compost metagenome]
MAREHIEAKDISKVIARVHQGAIDVLGRVGVPKTVHQAKFSMGTVLGLIAVHGKAGLTEFHELALTDPEVSAFRERVHMQLDPLVDQAYPHRWLGRVQVTVKDGRVLEGAIDEPKGDPGNSLSRPELEEKFSRLVAFSSALNPFQTNLLIKRVWSLDNDTELVTITELNDD